MPRLRKSRARLPELQTAAETLNAPICRAILPALTAVTLENDVITREAELSDLKQSLWSDAIALASVLGTQVEPVIEMKEMMP